jgi:hypothetical protein
MACIVMGGRGGDSIEYFRCFLIGNGRTDFESVVRYPEELALKDIDLDPDVMGLEDLLYVGNSAYQTLTEDNGPLRSEFEDTHQAAPSGEAWKEAELSRRFPRLAGVWIALWSAFGWHQYDTMDRGTPNWPHAGLASSICCATKARIALNER